MIYNSEKKLNASKSTIARLPYYLRTLRQSLEKNEYRISSTTLAKKMNMTPSQVRQDLSSLGAFGLKGYGYDVKTLYTSILDIAGVRDEYSAVILGEETMVNMLTSRPVFVKQGVVLKKVFTTKGFGTLADFEKYCIENRPDIVVLATNAIFTEKAVEIIKKLDIKGVWNFSNVKLRLHVPVKNIWIDDSLMTLCYEIGRKEELDLQS